MFMGDFVEKLAANTLVGDISKSPRLSGSPISGQKLTKSQRLAAKRAATSPLQAGNAKACATDLDLVTDVPSEFNGYDTDFPSSPLNSTLTQKGTKNGTLTSTSTSTATTPAFVLNGKIVPTPSSTGTFDYIVAKPILSPSASTQKKPTAHGGEEHEASASA